MVMNDEYKKIILEKVLYCAGIALKYENLGRFYKID